MVDDGSKPLAGTVSMLASRFKQMKSPTKPNRNPEVALSIEKVIEETRTFNNEKLVQLAMLLVEAQDSIHLDEFSSLGVRMQKLAKEVPPSLGNQSSALLETIPAFTWRLLQEGSGSSAGGEQKPKEHIEGCRDSTQYYLNRILLQAKQEGKQTNWPMLINQFYDALLKLPAKTGEPPIKSAGGEGKNQEFKSPAKNTAGVGKSLEVKPKVELQGNKWFIEKGRASKEPVIIKPESMGQGVIIEDCENIKVIVEGKVTAVSVNRCKRLTLQVHDIVSNVEAMSTTNSDFILLGRVPTVVLDGSEGIKVCLSEGSKDTQVLSSKCAEINLVIQKGLLTASSNQNQNQSDSDGEETVEIALPFQFKSVLNADGTVTTEAVKHAGA